MRKYTVSAVDLFNDFFGAAGAAAEEQVEKMTVAEQTKEDAKAKWTDQGSRNPTEWLFH